MTDFKVGDKIKFDDHYWIVEKIAPKKILLKGYGYKKWFPIEDINNNATLERLKND